MRFVGQNLKHYRLLERLDEEELGLVCKVHDTRQDVVRVVKMVKPALGQRFLETLRASSGGSASGGGGGSAGQGE